VIKDVMPRKKDKTENRVNTNMQALQLLLANDLFIEEVQAIRSKLPIRELKYIPIKSGTDFILKDSPSEEQELKAAIVKLIKKYKLPGNFNTALAMYILYDVQMVPSANFDIFSDSTNGELTNIDVRSYAPLTEKEQALLANKKNLIESRFQHKLPERNSRNLTRDLGHLIVKEASKVTGYEEIDDDQGGLTDRDLAVDLIEDHEDLYKDDPEGDQRRINVIKQARRRLKSKLKR